MILRIEQDQKQPPQRTLPASRGQQEPGTRCPNKRHCAEDRTFAPAFRTVAGNGWLGRATCWAAWIHHSPSLPITIHYYVDICRKMGMYHPKWPIFINFSWGKWWEKLVDFGAKAMAFHGFPPRPEAESRWGMLQRWAEKLPGFRKKSWASASHVLEIDELAVGWSIFAKPSKKIKKMQMPCCSGQRVVLCFLLQQPSTYLVWSRCVATAHLFVWCHWSCGMFVCGTFESRDA